MAKLFLVRYPDEPIPVPERKKTVIGRAKECDVVLRETRVSRRHAILEHDRHRKMFVIIDQGSSNGTYLNGTALAASVPADLHDRDKIRIASAVFTVRIVNSPAFIRNEFDELRDHDRSRRTEIFSVSELQCSPTPSLAGDLAHLCPVEIFQMLEAGHKSGVLTIRTPRGEGSFTIADGQILRASYGDLFAEQAVYGTLADTEGTFTFSARDIAMEESAIALNTTFLLMEGCRLLDEASHAAGGSPDG